MSSVSSPFNLPIGVLTDSYKITHFEMYPDANFMSAYGEFRAPFSTNASDHRLVFYGIRYIIEHYVARQWTVQDVENLDKFFSTHNAGFKPFPFPKELFLKFIKENDGYFPVKIEALPEGSVVPVHTPVYQISAKAEYSHLCTFLESLLTQVWYPTCVATLSRMVKEHIEDAFEKTVDGDLKFIIESRLHDFGLRSCTCTEQAMLGGTAHLLNFGGSDNLAACYFTQFNLNKGNPIGTSIPATEHSVMTSWRTEREAMKLMINKYGTGTFATVMDSYDYTRALTEIVPTLAADAKKEGGLWVFRPDSGDPVQAIIEALKAGEAAFGTKLNSKGYKVIQGAACIQGDGIDMRVVQRILEESEKLGFAANNIAFGMGGGLLQKVNRDTMSFATKLSYIEYADGSRRDVMKLPKTDAGKTSLPGILRVKRDPQTGLITVLPRNPDELDKYDSDDILRPVYDNRPLNVWKDETFDDVRERVRTEWRQIPKQYDPISSELKDKVTAWIAAQRKLLSERVV